MQEWLNMICSAKDDMASGERVRGGSLSNINAVLLRTVHNHHHHTDYEILTDKHEDFTQERGLSL